MLHVFQTPNRKKKEQTNKKKKTFFYENLNCGGGGREVLPSLSLLQNVFYNPYLPQRQPHLHRRQDAYWSPSGLPHEASVHV